MRLVDRRDGARGHAGRLVDAVDELHGHHGVVGVGAHKKANDFLALIGAYPMLRDAVDASVLVADRRWNLRLKNGIDVRLPEKDVETAIQTLVRLDRDKKLAAAFAGLTPGRRREYNLHFASAKQSATRESRIDKCVPNILAGKGMRDA